MTRVLTAEAARHDSAYSFDLDSEHLLTTQETGQQIATITRREAPHANQMRRWFRDGAHGVVLPSVVVGCKRFSSLGAVRWWIVTSTHAANQRLAAPAAAEGASPPCATLTGAERAALKRAGIEVSA